MPRITTSYAKNIIERAFAELVDRSPGNKEISRIWSYFDSSCAFCGRALRRGAREGRIDHLVAAAKGGWNSIGNRVLACGSCNDDEKLDQLWEDFLRVKVESDDVFEVRRKRITEWQEQNPISNEARHRELRDVAVSKAREVINVFNEKAEELRLLMRETS